MKCSAALVAFGFCINSLAAMPATVSQIHLSKDKHWDVTVAYPSFAGSSSVARLATKEYARVGHFLATDFVEQVKKGWDPKVGQGWVMEAKAIMGTESPKIVSGYYEICLAGGRPHSELLYRTINVGFVGGKAKILNLRDIAKSPADFDSIYDKAIIPALTKLKKERGINELMEFDKSLVHSFVITPGGITWMFEPYSVGPYIEGTYEVKVPWGQVKKYLRTDIGLPIR